MARFRTGIVCRKAADLVTEYLEGALQARDQARFEAHVASCPHCTEYLRQMRITISAAGRAGPEELPPETRRELAALYRRWRSS